jgi:hypothetical protein
MWFSSFQNQPRSAIAGKHNLTWLLGEVADSSVSFFRFCGLCFVGLIDFLFEDRLKRITFSGKAMSRSRVLLLRNFLADRCASNIPSVVNSH